MTKCITLDDSGQNQEKKSYLVNKNSIRFIEYSGRYHDDSFDIVHFDGTRDENLLIDNVGMFTNSSRLSKGVLIP